MQAIQSKTTPYFDVRKKIRNYDLLAFRSTGGLISREIADLGRSLYSHVAGAVWHADPYGGTLSCAQSREGIGGEVVSLSTQVRAFPGLIDVYTPKPDCSDELREAAATVMYRWAGNRYDYPGIWRVWLLRYPHLRRLLGMNYDPTDMTLSLWNHFKFCSVLYGWAARWAKYQWKQIACMWDAVPRLGDLFIEPGDLTRSGSFDLAFEGLIL